MDRRPTILVCLVFSGLSALVYQLIWTRLLGFSLGAGLVVSVFQALTQIHEMGLVFIFKIVTVALVLVIFMPWLLTHIADYTISILEGFSAFAQ